MSEAPGPINFTMFLTMFGERLNGTDPEDVIRNAFTCFDEDGSGNFWFDDVHWCSHGITIQGMTYTSCIFTQLFHEYQAESFIPIQMLQLFTTNKA